MNDERDKVKKTVIQHQKNSAQSQPPTAEACSVHPLNTAAFRRWIFRFFAPSGHTEVFA
jgi:hypothetical protein